MSEKKILMTCLPQDAFAWPVRDLASINSSFAMQEYLQDSLRVLPASEPLDKLVALSDDQDMDVGCWQNENIRFVAFFVVWWYSFSAFAGKYARTWRRSSPCSFPSARQRPVRP